MKVETYQFAALMPIKIVENDLNESQIELLEQLAVSLREHTDKTDPDGQFKITVKIYFGLDEDKKDSKASQTLKEFFDAFDQHFEFFGVDDKGKICLYWRRLADAAVRDCCDFYCLLGDDVKFQSKDWIFRVIEEFKSIQNDLKLSDELFGFGCVAMLDMQCLGFPTFPVLHRIHYEFNKELFSTEFVNQDADPFLFQLYRRFGASRFAINAKLRNLVGGVELKEDLSYKQPRYERKSTKNWQGFIDSSVEKFRQHRLFKEIRSFITLDVVVPTFRCKRDFLEPIINLKSTISNVNISFVLIVDNPKADITWLKELTKTRFDLRIRVNEINSGASQSRNNGIKESSGEWILFLDDDVIPNEDIIDVYVNSLKENSNDKYDGFVGYSELPEKPNEVFPTAVHFSGVSFFWRAALKMKEVPWGITANLLVRRSSLKEFDLRFIKTGGGEDIDFCLKLDKQPLKSVPLAKITHPWWDNGKRCYDHFFNWSYSDGMLVDIYPNLTYYVMTDWIEFNMISFIITTVIVSFLDVKSTFYLAWIISLVFSFIMDMFIDLMMKYNDLSMEPYSIGLIRIIAIMESTFIKNYSAYGRIYGHFSRGKLHNICKRFDWFCGLVGNVINKEKQNAFIRFTCYFSCVIMILRFMMYTIEKL